MRKIILLLALVLMLPVTSNALTIGEAHWMSKTQWENSELNFAPLSLRIAHDPWTGPDKIHHLLGGFGTTALSGLIWNANNNPRLNGLIGYNLAFWWLWEVKDAIVPWEFWGEIGGDGFSYKDGVWATAGVFVGAWLIKGVK